MTSKIVLCDIEGTTTSISFVKVRKLGLKHIQNAGFPQYPFNDANILISMLARA